MTKLPENIGHTGDEPDGLAVEERQVREKRAEKT
jgi:hypothetical protein